MKQKHLHKAIILTGLSLLILITNLSTTVSVHALAESLEPQREQS